jgi:HAD superfamily hydrolase (TIGR01509 family)
VNSPFSAVRAVFFDLDDTLCGYWEASKAGLREAFRLHAPNEFSPEEMIEHWATAFREFSPTLKQTGWYEGYLKYGEPTRTEQMRLTLMRIGQENPELAKSLSEAYAHHRNLNLKLFPDAIETLDWLKKRYDKMGLITNGPADIQRQEIATLGIERYFPHIYIEGEMGKGKPHQEIFQKIADEVGVQGKEMLFVGNSYAHDVRPALEAGWHSIWIRRETDVPPSMKGKTAKPEERPEGAPEPDAVIGNLTELRTLLGHALAA